MRSSVNVAHSITRFQARASLLAKLAKEATSGGTLHMMTFRRLAFLASALLTIGCGSSSDSDDFDAGAVQYDADTSVAESDADTRECTEDSTCDDGVFCNGAETCDAAGACVAGEAPSIDDGVACTDDSCDEDKDVVVNAPNNGSCDDGAFCNGVESCDPMADCVAGEAPSIDDGITCTDDSCDEGNDVVVNVANDGSCDDGLFCTGVEVCDVIVDCVPGTPPADDGFACTDDLCDEDNDVVLGSVANNANCDDVEQCTDDVCNPADPTSGADGCLNTNVPDVAVNDCGVAHGGQGCSSAACETCVCDADDFCCSVSWDGTCAGAAASGACAAECVSGPASCDDGDFCGGDTCQDGLCGSVCTDDANECTADVCDLFVDSCGRELTDATLTSCCAASGAGCDDMTCASIVCTDNPECCDVEWDAACALLAVDSCDVCFQEVATCADGAGLCNRGACDVP